MFERSIAERTKLRRGKSDEIERKEQKINNEQFKVYFTDFQSPSNMYKKLGETKDAVNEAQVNYQESLIIYLKMMYLRLKRMKR